MDRLRGASRHWPLLVVLVPAAALRVLAWLAIHPAWWFLGDAIDYVNSSVDLQPRAWRPAGYSLILLAPLSHFQHLSLVTAVQHLLGLGSAVVVYALLVHHRLPPWVAAFATLPMLFDGYFLATEQMLVSEPLFTALVVGAAALLLWQAGRPSLRILILAGTLLGLAAVTRSIGVVLPIVAAVVVMRRAGWVGTAALLIACALPIGLYAAWFDRTYHQPNLTASSGIFLYGRTIQFADCSRITFPDPGLAKFCPLDPPGHRKENFYDFDRASPLLFFTHSLTEADAQGRCFALAAIRSQPGDYAALVGNALTDYFGLDDSKLVPHIYRFRTGLPMDHFARAAGSAYQGGRDPTPGYRPALVEVLASYQRFTMIPGFGYLIALVVAVVGVLLCRDPRFLQLKRVAVLTAAMAFVLLVIPALTVPGDVRYRLPTLPLLGAAMTLGLWFLVGACAAWVRAR